MIFRNETALKGQAARLIEVLRSFKSLLILVKGSPDPDAIASSFAVKILCDAIGVRTKIVARQKLALTQNRLFVRKLNIPLHISEGNLHPERFGGYVILDFQSVIVEGVTGVIPCAVHIDHHKAVSEKEKVMFRSVRSDVGSTSTILALLIKEMSDIGLSRHLRRDIATSLTYGIQTDTDKYQHATPLDHEAISSMAGDVDDALIDRLAGVPLSERTAGYMEKAEQNAVLYKDWLIGGIGFIPETERDSIAIIADNILNRRKPAVAVVYAGIIRKKPPYLVLDASLRTNDEDIDLNRFIKRITPNGGARKFKGAFQIDMSYINSCKDREALWKVIDCATQEKLMKQREAGPAAGLGSFMKKFSGLLRHRPF